MDSSSIEAPAFFSLLVFLGINYFVGYELGQLLTASTAGAVLIALVMPCLSLVALALTRPTRTEPIDAGAPID
jgi:hypothetical protein